MNLVLDQLKGVLTDSISKFMKDNIKLEDADIKSIFGDSMDKVLYHDEGFVKDLSTKMSDVVMPAYVKELRYLKKIVSGIDDVSNELRQLQEKLAKELRLIKPNPQNVDETVKLLNNAVEKFVTQANNIAKVKIGLREIEGSEKTASMENVQIPPYSAYIPPYSTYIPPYPTNIPPYSTNIESYPTYPTTPTYPTPILKTQDDVSRAVINVVKNKISDIVKIKQGGGGVKHAPAIDEPIVELLESNKPPIKIPKRNYQDFTGNTSSLFNQIMKEKMRRGGTRKKRK